MRVLRALFASDPSHTVSVRRSAVDGVNEINQTQHRRRGRVPVHDSRCRAATYSRATSLRRRASARSWRARTTSRST